MAASSPRTRSSPSWRACDYAACRSFPAHARAGFPIARGIIPESEYYSDKHSIFRVAAEGATIPSKGVSQFGRALSELNIDIICANSPQAKGRVERMNHTLQDRLVKELRLRDIGTMAAGNAYLPEFMQDYNRRFARPPRNPHDAHRPLQGDEDLYRIFSWQEERTLSQSLTVNYKRVTYLIERSPETIALARKRVVVHEWEDGGVEIHCQGRKLPYSVFDKNPVVSQGAVVENKRLSAVLSLIQVAQTDRDRERLASRKLTKPTERPHLVPVPSEDGRLDAMLAYLEAFDEEQRAKRKLQNVTTTLRRRADRGLGLEWPAEAAQDEEQRC